MTGQYGEFSAAKSGPGRSILSHPLIFGSGRFATWGKDLALKMPSIRDEFGRILDLRWALARDQCASQPICALRVGPNRGKTPKSCPFKNEGIPERCGKPLLSGAPLDHYWNL